MTRKYLFAAAVLSLTMALAAGCGSADREQAAEQAAESSSAALLTAQQSDEITTENTPQQDQEGSANEKEGTESAELVFIGGKVRSVSEDSFVISRTLWEESADGQGANVVMPEAGSPEEELVTVRCLDSAVFERWTIKGGGADIIKEEAAFEEIQEGTGLEAQGYFDGETFVAEKVIIEVYE